MDGEAGLIGAALFGTANGAWAVGGGCLDADPHALRSYFDLQELAPDGRRGVVWFAMTASLQSGAGCRVLGRLQHARDTRGRNGFYGAAVVLSDGEANDAVFERAAKALGLLSDFPIKEGFLAGDQFAPHFDPARIGLSFNKIISQKVDSLMTLARTSGWTRIGLRGELTADQAANFLEHLSQRASTDSNVVGGSFGAGHLVTDEYRPEDAQQLRTHRKFDAQLRRLTKELMGARRKIAQLEQELAGERAQRRATGEFMAELVAQMQTHLTSGSGTLSRSQMDREHRDLRPARRPEPTSGHGAPQQTLHGAAFRADIRDVFSRTLAVGVLGLLLVLIIAVVAIFIARPLVASVAG